MQLLDISMKEIETRIDENDVIFDKMRAGQDEIKEFFKEVQSQVQELDVDKIQKMVQENRERMVKEVEELAEKIDERYALHFKECRKVSPPRNKAELVKDESLKKIESVQFIDLPPGRMRSVSTLDQTAGRLTSVNMNKKSRMSVLKDFT